MSHSVLLAGGTSAIGRKISSQLELMEHNFSRVAVLSHSTEDTSKKDSTETSRGLDLIKGSPSDPDIYRDFDIVVWTIGDIHYAEQTECIDAALAAGIKHIYLAECGPDFSQPLVQDDRYLINKHQVRIYVEGRVQTGMTLGYTYSVTGILADFLLESNVLGLDRSTMTATYIGHPDARISTTHSEDVAKFVVSSLLPTHLQNLNARRYIRFAGSTQATSSLFDAISYVLQRPLNVNYRSLESSDELLAGARQCSRKRSEQLNLCREILRFGGFELNSCEDYDGGQHPSAGVVVCGDEYIEEIRPKGWVEVVNEFFKERGK